MATPPITLPNLQPPTPKSEMDQAIVDLQGRKNAWLEVSLEQRIQYLRNAVRKTEEVAARQVEAEMSVLKMHDIGEAWLAGPIIQARVMRLLANSLEEVMRTGTVTSYGKVRTRSDGQVKVEVLPTSIIDRLLWIGYRGEIWMDREVTEKNLQDFVATQYKNRPTDGKVSLVLAAGNVSSIGPLDVIHKLFVEDQVVLLKFNPVNEHVGLFQEEVFEDLIRDGFLRTAYGGAEVGEYLCQHNNIDEVHITGSNITHDIIVYGSAAEGAERKARIEPRLKKRITSELGNVSPVIVYPGKWSDGDLTHQAESIASQMTNNGGFNCNAAKVLILHADWPQKQAFLDRLGNVLNALSDAYAYYPGTEQRWQTFLDAHEKHQSFGEKKPNQIPPTLLLDLDYKQENTLAFNQESWCAVTGVTEIPGKDGAEFLDNAVQFANDVLFGTLNASIVIDPKSQKALGDKLEDAISDLRYGTVTTNQWAAVSFGLGSPSWGAFPGHTLDDIQSGIGAVHNTYLFSKPEKTVIYCPFRATPKPPWFVTHKNAEQVTRRVAEMEASPSFFKLPGILAAALKG